MLYSNSRMEYINNYFSIYEIKIRNANNCGLNNDAKLFEVFALKVCELWFNKEFENLNIEKLNNEIVDIISLDKKVFVQVTTQKDLKSKISGTFNSINNSDMYSHLDEVYFFVLNNNDEKCHNLVNHKYKNIYFNYDKHVITTRKVLNKATCDIDFQNNIYDLCKNDEISSTNVIVNKPKFEISIHNYDSCYKNIELKIVNVSNCIVSSLKGIRFEFKDMNGNSLKYADGSIIPNTTIYSFEKNNLVQSAVTKIKTNSPDLIGTHNDILSNHNRFNQYNFQVIFDFSFEDEMSNEYNCHSYITIPDAKSFCSEEWRTQFSKV